MKKIPKYLYKDGITVEIANGKEFNRLSKAGYTVPEFDPEVPILVKEEESSSERPVVAEEAAASEDGGWGDEDEGEEQSDG